MEAPTPVSALLHAATYLNFLNIILTQIFYIKALTYHKGRNSPTIVGGRQNPFFQFKNNSFNKSFHSNAHHTKVGIRRQGDDLFIPPYPLGAEKINFFRYKCFKLNKKISQLTAFK
jgi:hypothetical protein